MSPAEKKRILVTGASGFIGKALVPVLAARGHAVRCATRRIRPGLDRSVDWVEADLLEPATLSSALDGADCAFYLVHSMGGSRSDYAVVEQQCAGFFADAAAKAGVERIVYLGGPAPRSRVSPHLASRLLVGEILRRSAVKTIELRASMVMGQGSTSWQIVRDLSLRLPAMILPAWLESRTAPVALDDVVGALADAATLPIERSEWFDLPGPELLSGREILERIVALRGRALPAIRVPLLTPQLSALWLKFVTGADFSIARELVLGLSDDLIPHDGRFWEMTVHGPRVGFDDAAAALLRDETRGAGLRAALSGWEESIVDRLSPRVGTARDRASR